MKRIRPRSVYVSVAILILANLTAVDAVAQARGGSRNRRAASLSQAMSRLEKDKSAFEAAKQGAMRRVSAEFGALIKGVQQSDDIEITDRGALLKELRDAKAEFESNQKLTPSPLLQNVYAAYIVAVRARYYALLNGYEQALALMPVADERRAGLEKEVDQLSGEVNRLDMLQPGKTWRGYRSDVKPPPRLVPNGIWMRNWHIVQDKAVNVDFSFKVTSRKGGRFLGQISQSGGGFIGAVEGTFDGVNLAMKMTDTIRGEPRHFEYAGQVVGALGFLSLQGYKTDGNYTEGNVVIQLGGN